MGFYTPSALLFLLFVLPLVTAYQTWARSGSRAVVYVTFFAALFGPEVAYLKLPGIPPLDKHNLPYIYLMIAALVTGSARLKKAKPLRGLDLLAIVLALSAFVTMSNNGDTLTFGGWAGSVTLPGLVINDGIQMAFQAFTSVYFPFLLGKAYIRKAEDVRMLMRFLTSMALVQTAMLLVELRVSPQWHIWVYGYGAHNDFLQTIRWGGYRPMNLTAHGLALAIFMLGALMATAVNFKIGERFRIFKRRVTGKQLLVFLSLILVSCKSTGAIMMALLLVPLVLRSSLTAQRRVAMTFAVLLVAYPSLRASQWVPVDDLVEAAENTFGEERAQSLAFRFDNEEDLLTRASERFYFGWGGQGRRNIFSDEDGKEVSVSDGAWIIVLGMVGFVGFLCTFGLISFPVIQLTRQLKRLSSDREARMATGLALIVAAMGIDLVPNGMFSKYIFVLAGACAGVAAEIKASPKRWRLRN